MPLTNFHMQQYLSRILPDAYPDLNKYFSSLIAVLQGNIYYLFLPF